MPTPRLLLGVGSTLRAAGLLLARAGLVALALVAAVRISLRLVAFRRTLAGLVLQLVEGVLVLLVSPGFLGVVAVAVLRILHVGHDVFLSFAVSAVWDD